MAKKKSTFTESKLLERLTIATRAAGIYVWELDWRTERIAWDESPVTHRSSNRHFGYEFGSDLFKWVHPEDLGIGHGAITKALAEGDSDAAFVYRLKLGDGSIRHIKAYARTSTDESGKPLKSLGVSWDVTREVEADAQLRAQAEQLHEAQRRLERAALSIHEGHWEADLLTDKHWASSSYYALLGYTPGEMSLDTVDEVARYIHPEDLPKTRASSEAHIRSGVSNDHELRMRLKDGSYRWFRVRAVAQRDPSGRALRVSGSIQDIQKQKLVEDELRAARQRFERAIRGTQDGLWEWDLTTHTLWVSPRYEALLGYSEGDLMVGSPNALVHADEVALCRAAQLEHFERGTPYDVEVRMQTKSGDYRWIRMRGEADRDAAGTPLRLAGSISDVTDARAAREALIRASEAAQSANRSKSDFLANMSHEIRTPMNGIIGMTSLLLDTTLDPAQREFAETIRASAHSLLTIINDVLDFSKIEAGKLDIESIEMQLPDIAREVLQILSFHATAKNLPLSIEISPDLPHTVRGDPQRIRQCLINLVGNAIKFTPAGQVLVRIAVAGRRDGHVLVRFEVRDTGIGIEPGTLATLFQPFVQADSSTTRHFGGTGLGLSIVRRLVEMMGGEIGVESIPQQGSRFWFVLPLPVIATRAAGPPPRALAPTGSPARARYAGRVLLVEDNPVNQKVARRFLERVGCEVTLANNGAEALAVFGAGEFRLVLLDLQMPVMDGYTATGRLRELEQGRSRTPIVALTASAMSGQRERCLEAGMDELLTKPLDVEQLCRVLDRFGLRGRDGAEPVLDEAAVAELVSTASVPAAVDLAGLRQVSGDDPDFTADLARSFLDTCAMLLAQIREGLRLHDRERIARAAHSLKGASASVHALPLVRLSRLLEEQAAVTDSDLSLLVRQIETESERAGQALQGCARVLLRGASRR